MSIHHLECHVYLDTFSLAHHNSELGKRLTSTLYREKIAEDLEEDLLPEDLTLMDLQLTLWRLNTCSFITRIKEL